METEGFAIYDAMMQLKNEVSFFSKFSCISSLCMALLIVIVGNCSKGVDWVKNLKFTW